MKQLTATKQTPQNIKAVYRFIGKEIYIKVNSTQYAAQILDRYKKAGVPIVEKGGWMKIDLFYKGDMDYRMGGFSFDISKETPEEIESKMCSFFKGQLEMAMFEVEEQ